MGEIIDELSNYMPVPGNGRAKRARIDREGNMVVGDLYYYTDSDSLTLANRASLRQLLTDSETLTGAGALSLTSPISIISGGAAFTLAAGIFIGQRKVIVNVSGTNTVAGPFLGANSPLTLNSAGETVSLLFIAPNWVIVGSSIREITGTPIANAVGVVGAAP